MTAKIRWIALATAAVFAVACGQYSGVHEEANRYTAVANDGGGGAGQAKTGGAGDEGVNRDGASGGIEGAQIQGSTGSTLGRLGTFVRNLPQLQTKDDKDPAQGSEPATQGAGKNEQTSSGDDPGESSGPGKTGTAGEKDPAATNRPGGKGTDGTKKPDATSSEETPTTVGEDDPTTDDPATDDPVSDDPATDDPVSDDPGTEDPAVEDPATTDLEEDADFIDQITQGYARHNVTVLPADFPFVICPVQGEYGYSPGFGDLRCVSDEAWCGGFHYHQGVDIFADLGTPLVAPFDGYVEDATNYVGGLAVRIRGAYGYTYNAHLVQIRKEVVGQTVPAGTVVGWIGNTGNAKGTAYHNHFEWHPNEGDAIDPFPYLVVVCPPG